MAKLMWTDEARGSLVDIYDYIAKQSIDAALRTIEGIYRKSEVLQDFPRIGFLHRKADNEEVRIVLYGHYRIVYLVDGDCAIVTGVVHTSRWFDEQEE